MKKIAIVGSSESHWTPERRTKAVLEIIKIFHTYAVHHDDFSNPPYSYDDLVLVSGGCPKGGIDIWAEITADVFGIKKEIHYPEVLQWEDKTITKYDHSISGDISSSKEKKKGYKTRNIEIASECDILYCIDPKDRNDGGGFWTYYKAKELGKEVHRILIDLEF